MNVTIHEDHLPLTVPSLVEEFTDLGVTQGMTLMVHTSMKSFGRWIVGGSNAVILALEKALGESGTLVMPTHTGDLTDPSGWSNPPVPEDWWEIIRREMPAFEPDLTPTRLMGATAEAFRKQHGTLRSNHPQVSFAARGFHAEYITGGHSLSLCLGEQSPLARLYDCDGWVLLIGVGHNRNTSLHLAEYRASYPGKKEMKLSAPCKVNGVRQWITSDDIDFDSDDFPQIGASFERDTNLVLTRKVGEATLRLMPQRALVDYAVKWMENHRDA